MVVTGFFVLCIYAQTRRYASGKSVGQSMRLFYLLVHKSWEMFFNDFCCSELIY